MKVKSINKLNTKNILIWPNLNLMKKSELVTKFDHKLNQLIIDMLLTLKTNGGLGLSACQIGVNQAVFVYKVGTQEGAMINPAIYHVSDGSTHTSNEGCLSFPGISMQKERWNTIELKYQDENGEDHSETFTGMMGDLIQHEVDHINGKTIISDLSKIKRDMVKQKMNKHLKKVKLFERKYNDRAVRR